MLKSRSVFRWFLFILRDKLDDQGANDILREYTDEELEKFSDYFKQADNYSKILSLIFGEPTNDPISTLQKNGYFASGNEKIFQTGDFNESEFEYLIESVMNAYIDRAIPLDKIRRQTNFNRCIDTRDSETMLCSWVNIIACKNKRELKPVSTISSIFLELPNMKYVLYSFDYDKSLTVDDSNGDRNAELIINKCKEIGVPQLFDIGFHRQKSVVLKCFVLEVIDALSRINPSKHNRIISLVDIENLKIRIAARKVEVASIRSRVNKLSREVSTLRKSVELQRSKSAVFKSKMSLAASILSPYNSDSVDKLPSLNKTGPSRPASNIRVKWDIPDYIPLGRRNIPTNR